MLHSIDDSGSAISMTADELRSLLRSIAKSGHRVVPLETLLAEPSKHRAVALTFDDGAANLAEVAAPILSEWQAPATVFLTTGRIGGNNQWPGQSQEVPELDMLTWDGARSLVSAGWKVGSHTVSHPDLRLLDDSALEEELLRSKDIIRKELGSDPEGFAYPYGYFDRRVMDFVKAHYRYAVTTVMAPVCHRPDSFQIPRLDSFYFRSPAVHQHFGTRAFAGYLTGRGFLRRLRTHPGEIHLP